MLSLLLLLQAAAGPAPDIELNVSARARSVEIRQKGEAKLVVRGAEGSVAEARVTPAPEGKRKLRNVRVELRAAASVGEGPEITVETETGTPE